MAENTDGVPADIKGERVEQLVANINAKCDALQRHLMQSSQSQSTLWNALTLGSAAFEGRSSVPLISPSANGVPSVPTTHLSLVTASNRPRGPTYWQERELYVAASELCHYLNGGVNYRTMCMQYQSILEPLLKMLREDIQLARHTDFLPGGTLDRAHAIFSQLLNESKELLVENGVIPRSEVRLAGKVENKDHGKAGETSNHEYTLPVALTCTESYNTDSSTQNRSSERHSSGRGNSGRQHESRVTISAPTEGSDQEKPYSPLPLYNSASKCASEDIYDVQTPHVLPTEECTGNRFQANSSARPGSEEALRAESSPRNRSRYHCMEELYNELYLHDGMNMLIEMMRVVFLKEYNNADSKTVDEAFSKFRENVDNDLLPHIQSYDALVSPTKVQPLLRSAYVLNCLQRYIQPNERLLAILQHIDSERDATSLFLVNMSLRDTDMKPFVALLPRLSHLRYLDLSHNDIHDAGVRELCSALEGHPSLELLDLSDNPLTDAAGAELIQLAATTTHLKAVGQQGIAFSHHIREALGSQLQKNRSACGTSFTPNHILNGVGVGGSNQNELWKRSLTRRLAPLALVDESQPAQTLKPSPGEVLQAQGMSSLVSRSLGMMRRVRLPYLTATRGGQANRGKRVTDSSPR
ncbi:uncharacterized protein Tco025E_06115 [Trypanosoma conorhini]|uniref:Leucine-rich repeat protein (LRRP) n=1 Tax=Trypanosoma conorhini TaxID=83891 RepID=A0A3S5ISV6_9TRYP|nr:uncharacterized protein Tco025E_06115 [Trypanosoma conorhini]RNF13626.1 hypothetical protein Tco025E_06115 [Trypanosoma conorhini]